MIDLFAEATAIARNMIAPYLTASSEERDHLPGASIARNAWEKVESKLVQEGWNDIVEQARSNPGETPYDLPRPLMKLMKKDDDFAAELRQLYDSYLQESSSVNINVSQYGDNISGSGKVVGGSVSNIGIGSISQDIKSYQIKSSKVTGASISDLGISSLSEDVNSSQEMPSEE